MSPLRINMFAWLGCLFALPVWAGEIIIIDQVPEGGSRTERGAGYARDEARRQAGKPSVNPGVNVIITGDQDEARNLDRAAEQASREAREYLNPSMPSDPGMGEGTTIILRAAPVSDAERSRMRARSYTAPRAARATRDCSSATSQVGTIGEGPNAERGSVVERGTSSVSTHCK